MFAPPVAIRQKASPRRASRISPQNKTLAAQAVRGDWNPAYTHHTGAGNQATSQRRLQAKLAVGSVNDPLEHEADQVAEQVMRVPDPKASIGAAPPLINRKCAACADEEANTLQAKPDGMSQLVDSDVSGIVHDVLRSPGDPLDASARDFMETRFHHDFSRVRVHADAAAAASARSVNSLAYTVGDHIIFGAGQYAPGTLAGKRLLAHELTHAVQQSPDRHGTSADASPGPRLQRQPPYTPPLAGPYSGYQSSTFPPPGPAPTVLVDDFAAKFPVAAKLIRSDPAAMKLVKEASDAGAKFGGFAEDGPAPTIGRAYTAGNTVYVPKARGGVEAMRDFLFELNNAIRSPKVAALQAAAAAGKKTDAGAAKKHAHDRVELEVEGMLRLGEVWFETKKHLGPKSRKFDTYDEQFYLAEYESFKKKQKTKEDIITDVLQRKYDTGTLKGKTVEQFYLEEYQGLAQ
jgi:hypothetical protein